MTGVLLNEPHFATADECRACPYPTPCVIRPSERANLRIAPPTAFDCIFGASTLSGDIPTLLDGVERQVRNAADARFGAGSGSGLPGGGINNARGKWLEYALQVIFWNATMKHDAGKAIIVKLPNSSQLQFRNLYKPVARAYLDDLFKSLNDLGMDMQMSNPDFICVTDVADESGLPLKPVNTSETINSDAGCRL